MHGPTGVGAVVFPAQVPRRVFAGNRQGVLESRRAGAVFERPPEHPGDKFVGTPGTGGPDQHPQEVWQNHICEHVRCSDDLQRCQSRAQHLLNVQTHQPEAAQERQKVHRHDIPGSPDAAVQDHPGEPRGDILAGTRRTRRHQGGELISLSRECSPTHTHTPSRPREGREH